MTAGEWERANAQFLTEALAWLRERLERYIAAMHGEGEHDIAAADDEPAPPAAKPKRRVSAAKPPPDAVDSATAPAHVPIDTNQSPPPALAILGQRFGLTPFESDVLLLCVAFELDTRIGGLCARAHDDPQRPYPTFALALTLFDDPAWDVTSTARPLRRWQLVDVDRRPASPLTLSPLHSDARAVDFIKGFNRIDERLATLVVPLEDAVAGPLPASQLALVERIVSICEGAGAAATLQLTGPNTPAKLGVASAVGEQLQRNVWRLRAAWLPPAQLEIDEIARLWQREVLLVPTLLVLDAQDVADEREPETTRGVRRFLSRRAGDVLLVTRLPWPGLDEAATSIEVDPPTPAEQRDAWNRALEGADAGSAAAQLAAQFRLDLPAIKRIADTAGREASDVPLAERLWSECCRYLKPNLDSLATRIDAKSTWDDIVLPSEQTDQLRQIAQHVRGRHTVYEEWGFADRMSRGLGISVLFAGDSGTGKTMAAEVLANDLRLPLYRIDLSAVVSKYIGETEKNLRALFDAADSGGFVLFFDEADALFGKRSEVRDSHDRYANIEVNYLLQRIEAYRGLAILATNAKSALDPAFVRRLRFIVSFPHPAQADRKRIWEKSFTAKTPTKGLDLDRLARLNATGGVIHNASLGAAFAAAGSDGAVNMPLVLAAIRAEFIKLNRPINGAEFPHADLSVKTD